jgi:hypothetical protein
MGPERHRAIGEKTLPWRDLARLFAELDFGPRSGNPMDVLGCQQVANPLGSGPGASFRFGPLQRQAMDIFRAEQLEPLGPSVADALIDHTNKIIVKKPGLLNRVSAGNNF